VISSGERKFLGVVDLWQGDAVARAAGDDSAGDRVVQDSSEQLVGLSDRRRGVPVGVEVPNPFLDIEDADGADRYLGEGR
jgi:hypothetical protein